MKVAKEEIIGLITALQIFMQEDEDTETNQYIQVSQSVVDALVEIPGLNVTLEHNVYNYLVPTALITFTNQWTGPSRDQILAKMAKGPPPIHLHPLGNPDELAVDPTNLDENEKQIVIRRLREELLSI